LKNARDLNSANTVMTSYPANAKKHRDAPAITPENPIGTNPPGKLVQFVRSARQKPKPLIMYINEYIIYYHNQN